MKRKKLQLGFTGWNLRGATSGRTRSGGNPRERLGRALPTSTSGPAVYDLLGNPVHDNGLNLAGYGVCISDEPDLGMDEILALMGGRHPKHRKRSYRLFASVNENGTVLAYRFSTPTLADDYSLKYYQNCPRVIVRIDDTEVMRTKFTPILYYVP